MRSTSVILLCAAAAVACGARLDLGATGSGGAPKPSSDPDAGEPGACPVLDTLDDTSFSPSRRAPRAPELRGESYDAAFGQSVVVGDRVFTRSDMAASPSCAVVELTRKPVAFRFGPCAIAAPRPAATIAEREAVMAAWHPGLAVSDGHLVFVEGTTVYRALIPPEDAFEYGREPSVTPEALRGELRGVAPRGQLLRGGLAATSNWLVASGETGLLTALLDADPVEIAAGPMPDAGVVKVMRAESAPFVPLTYAFTPRLDGWSDWASAAGGSSPVSGVVATIVRPADCLGCRASRYQTVLVPLGPPAFGHFTSAITLFHPSPQFSAMRANRRWIVGLDGLSVVVADAGRPSCPRILFKLDGLHAYDFEIDETHAYVTTTASDSYAPSLYRVDLATGEAEQLYLGHVPPSPRPDAPLGEPDFLQVVAVTATQILVEDNSYQLWRFSK